MQTEPNVLTEYNELICSTSIERVVSSRDAALLQIEKLIQQLDAISRLTSEVGGGTAQDWAMKSGHRYDSWLTEKVDKAMPAITRNIDRSIWRDLMLKSGMMGLMDAQARDQWHKNLEEGDLPAISEANILSTFEQLHLNKMDVFERGIINVFKGLSWDYKTNSPCSFGKKIIINNLVTYNRWGFSLNWGWRRDQMAHLEREVFIVMYLDNQHCLLGREALFTGTLSHTEVHPREVVKSALKHNAAAVILAHNHPSGTTEIRDHENFPLLTSNTPHNH
ncbi:DUF4942 domain-containing protein, partial [Citrobacter freundii]|uniref:DUF4942 domain-containing protein n=1 Tax=Citrobacter freundii TaxID=546 RepID=UPI00177C10D7